MIASCMRGAAVTRTAQLVLLCTTSLSMLVSDELACRSKRLLERRNKQAQFRDANKLLDNFDFQFTPK
jgi:DNA replication protein DnaC